MKQSRRVATALRSRVQWNQQSNLAIAMKGLSFKTMVTFTTNLLKRDSRQVSFSKNFLVRQTSQCSNFLLNNLSNLLSKAAKDQVGPIESYCLL